MSVIGLLAAETAAGPAPFPILPALIIIPVLTAVVIAFLPASRAEYTKAAALIGSTITGAVSIYLLAAFDKHVSDFQFVSSHTWLPGLGLSWFLGVDGISLFLVVLTGILFPVAILTTEAHHEPKPYYLWLMLLMAGTIGAFLALDLLLFFGFFEVVLVPMYFLIGGWGHGERVRAAMKFFIYTMAASALMLVGILSLWYLAGGTTFNVVTLAQTAQLSHLAQLLIFLSFAGAFAVKVPLFPLHTWLPDAHTEAPTAGSVILAGVMLKLGTYGFIRFGLYLFPSIARELGWLFFTLGVIGIVYGAAVATMQHDLKRLVAYSSIAHLGFIVLGIFAINRQGLEGAILQMVNHGLSTGALFILVGWIYERRHTREISQLAGLQGVAPIMAGAFTLVMLSSIGLPGLNGFVGEFLILLGSFASARWWTVVGATGVILAALYMLWAYQRVFHGQAEGDNATMRDLKPSELLGLAPLLILIVGLGVYPKPVLERIEPSVTALVANIETRTQTFHPEPADPACPVGTRCVIEPAGVEDLTRAAEEAEKTGAAPGEKALPVGTLSLPDGGEARGGIPSSPAGAASGEGEGGR